MLLQAAIFLFARHLIPVFCAPSDMPCVFSDAVASPNQVKFHEIAFLSLEKAKLRQFIHCLKSVDFLPKC